jgi:glycosyltransferase involved in cell wall biosynthesis
MVSEHASPLAAPGEVDSGGQNVHVAALSTRLGELGADVVVHTRRQSPEIADRVALGPGVVVDHVSAGPPRVVAKDQLFGFMDDFAASLRQQWSVERPDIVHAHFWMSGYAAIRAARPLDIPVVQTFHALGVVKRRHQGEKDTSPSERIDIESAVARSADHIVATCSDEVFELVRMGARAGDISVVPCGVDVSLFRPSGPAEPRDRRLRRLVVVSRLVERKGIGNVIAALPCLPDTELVIAGGGASDQLDADPEVRRLTELARRLGVGHRVAFRGGVNHERLPALLRSADAVICVPWYEPFGIVPLEAMACGVPVIASAVGGLVDTVVDGVTGLHVPPRQPASVARAASRLLADPEYGRALGGAGAQRAHRRYSWQRVGAATLDVYRRVAGTVLVPAWRQR